LIVIVLLAQWLLIRPNCFC